ncbi:hypothetical protein BJX63DRAFT_438460 [Aspergillus granulosus]|uniref:Zn(2)-C6 fungal-type domain-containing protein n=1 Tax=Aspergillus granulosus TaxID=176169 RepID=A0ABR4GRX2_9EURO
MVFTGSRSTGCERCRQRKIKCDQKRPGCRRCELNKAQCPGYERPLDIRFHSGPRGFPSFTKAYREWRRRRTTWNAQSPTTSVDVGRRVHLYFVHEFSFAPKPDLCSGHLEFLQGLLESPSETSPLRPATLASSYLSLSRRYESSELYVQARKYYGTALQSIRTILSKPLGSWQEEIVAAIMLLHMFECPTNEHLIFRLSPGSLLLAVNHCLATFKALHSIHGYFSQLQIHAFTTNQTFNCLFIPASEVNIAHSPTGIVVMVSKVGRFWFSLQQLLKDNKTLDPTNHRDRLMQMMHEAMLTQAEIERWETSLSAVWKPRVIDADDGQPLVTYSTRWLGITWTLYSATLAIFYHGVLRCCRALTDTYQREPPSAVETNLLSTSFAMAEQNIVYLIERICNSIPFSLGEVGCDGRRLLTPDYKGCVCYHIIWPLALVMRSRHSSADQVQLCRRTLARIRDMYGINLAQCVGGDVEMFDLDIISV